MLVIRVEHPSDGLGLFRSHDCYDFGGLLDMYKRHKDLPVPSSDGLSLFKDKKDWFCAYKTVEQFLDWVTTEEVKILIYHGFNIHMLDVEEYQEGTYQVIYTKESIISNKIINDLFEIQSTAGATSMNTNTINQLTLS